MALKPENPVVGGTVLRRAAIQSPNYVPGVSGWTIKQDGSVEFNNGIFRGSIIGGSLFIYTGVPALGNPPIFWAAGAMVDPFGNVLPSVAGVAGAGTFQAGKASDTAQVVLLPGMGGSAAKVQFPVPSVSLLNIPNLAGGLAGAVVQQLLSGPALAAAGDTDWVQIIQFSNDTAGTAARCEFRYIDTAGVTHVIASYSSAGWTINGTLTVTGTANINGSPSVGFPNPN
ncbi:MAG: hypothetical protein KGJ07_10370, partial [Patescibacteria group bacterium]|nr:hypothetical protein [Patescibacteria group bacterium]